MSNVVYLNEGNYDETINTGVVVVDFFAEWCGPCKMLGPVIEELAEEYAGKVKICKVDIDNNENLAAKFNIRGVPTILVYKNGSVSETLVGFRSKDDFKKIIDSLL